MIALRLYDGIIKIINLHTSGRQLQANTQRIEEIQVLDMVFLHTANKPTLAQNKDAAKAKKDSGKPFDPFMPPFEPGLFIQELSPTHNLLFNKFCICREHVLVVTKEMER